MRQLRNRSAILVAATASLWLACAGAVAEPDSNPEPGDKMATRINTAPPYFDQLQIVSTRSMPPQFKLTATREMPTPGYEFSVESVELKPSEARIVARVVETKPSGMLPQVMTPTALQLDLGELPKGRYLIELWIQRNGAKPQLAQAWILAAH